MSDGLDNDAILNTTRNSRKVQPLVEPKGWGIGEVLNKMTEEYGEFSEAILIERGLLPHKEWEFEAPFYEMADVIICGVDALARLYPDKSAAQITILLQHALNKKNERWVNRIMQEAEDATKAT